MSALSGDRRQPRTFQGFPETITDGTLRAVTHLVAEYMERIWDDITGIYDDLSFLAEHNSDGTHRVDTITTRTAETSSVLADDLILLYDLSATALRKMTLANATKMTVAHNSDGTQQKKDYTIGGLGLSNNGSDATNDIDIAVGQCLDLTASANEVIVLASALTKQLDVAWAAGTNQGMLDTGAVGNSTYHIFAIKNPTSGVVDILASLSASSPTMPSGYTIKRRIGSVIRSGGANVVFKQFGDLFLRSVPANDINVGNPGTAAVTATLSVPTGVNVQARISAMIIDASPTADVAMLVTSPDQADTAPSGTIFTIRQAAQGAGVPGTEQTMLDTVTNTSAQIRYRLDTSDADIAVRITTHAWLDRRGQDGV